MTVAATTLTTYNSWLLDNYIHLSRGMEKMFNTTSYFMDEGLFGRELAKISDGGNQFVFPIRTGRYTGWGSRGENVNLPDARSATHTRATGTLRNIYMQGRITGVALDRARSSEHAFFESLEDLMVELPEDFGKFFSQMCERDGRGAIARINEADPTTNTALILDANGATGGDETYGTVHMHAGMEISYFGASTGGATTTPQAALGTARNADSIVSAIVSGTEATVAANPGAGVANNDYVAWRQNASAVPTDITGLNGHLNNFNFQVHGINKSTNTFWQPSYITGAVGDATAFSLDHFDTAIANMVIANGPKAYKGRLAAITSSLMQNNIAREMKDLVQFEADDFDLKWGFSTLSYVRSGVRASIVADDDTLAGTIYYCDPSTFKFHHGGSTAPKIIKDDNLVLRKVADVDAWEMTYGWRGVEMVCYNPRRNGVRKGYILT